MQSADARAAVHHTLEGGIMREDEQHITADQLAWLYTRVLLRRISLATHFAAKEKQHSLGETTDILKKHWGDLT